jgi:predicted ATPase
MIDSITISNFKCFEIPQQFELKHFNIFTGYNGRGKSSVFQSLLLLSQSLEKYGNVEKLQVNGNYVSLDLFEDLVNCKNPGKPIVFRINQLNPSIDVELGYRELTERIGKLDLLSINGVDYFNQKVSTTQGQGEITVHSLSSDYPQSFHDMFRNFEYVSAFRVGPTLFEEKSDLNKVNPVGRDGEHSLSVIANNPDIIEAINDRMSYIMDGVQLEIRGTDRKDSVLKLFLKINDNEHEFKAINCGFGFRYILPIVVSALTMQSGCLFIENPEAHLHPKAQSRLMEVICQELSSKDVQVFIETHSEHIINAIRLNSLKSDCSLNYNDVNIYFFDEYYKSVLLEMDENGQIVNWPIGFFDQQEEDLSQILKLGMFK